LIKIYLAGSVPATAIDSSISKSIGFSSTRLFVFIHLEVYFIFLSSVLVYGSDGIERLPQSWYVDTFAFNKFIILRAAAET